MKAPSPQRTPRLSSDGVRLSAALKLGISFLLTCLALVQFTRALLQPPNELPQEPATKSLQPRLISHGKPAWMQSLRIWSESSTAGSRRGPVGTVQVQQVFKPLESANTATAAAAVHLGGLQLGPGGHVKVPFRTGHTGYQRPSGERTVSRRQMELPAVTGEASELEPAQQEQQIDAGRAARLADKSHKQGQQIIITTKQQQGSRAQVEHEQQAEQQAGQEPRLLRQRQQQQQQRIPGQETLLEDQMPIAESEGQATPQQALYVGHADAASTSDALRVASGDTQQDGLHFSLYILEGNTVLRQIPHLAHVQCDIHSPLVWPHVMRGRGVDSSHSTPHWAYQHAVQWWVTQALRNSTSIRLVDSMDEADLVYVDLYCLSMWWYSFHNPRGERNQPPPTDYKVSVVRHIQQLERFRRKQGADFVFLESHPGLVNVPGTPPFDQQAMCTGLHRSFWLVSESASVCRENHQEPGPHLLLPYNTVTDLHLERPLKRSSKSIFLFYRGGCAPGPPDPALAPQYSSGKLLRAAVVEGIRALPQALTGLGNRTRVECSCDICPGHLSHQKTLQQLASSLFCPVIPGDTQSSRRVSEVILSGCIPVFLGPPFHTLPLADAVNYTAFSVFIRLNETSPWIFERRSSQGVINDRQRVENLWRPDVDLEGAAHSVPSVADAYRYLQSIPPADIDRMLAALGRERLKLLYSPPPGGQTSQLAELLVARLARHAQAVQQLQPVQEASEDATQRAAAMLRGAQR